MSSAASRVLDWVWVEVEAEALSGVASWLAERVLCVEGGLARSLRPRNEEVEARGSRVVRSGASEGAGEGRRREMLLLPLMWIEGAAVWV
jgi:hypothetical protein